MRMLLSLLLIAGMLGCRSEEEPAKALGEPAASTTGNATTATTADSPAVVVRQQPTISRGDIVLKSVKPAKGGGGATSRYGLTHDDFRRLVETIPTLRQAVPVRFIDQEVRHGTEAVAARVVETTVGFDHVFQLEIARGRSLMDSDKGKRVAVIGADVAGKLFPGELAIGKDISIDKHLFMIVGQAKVGETSAKRPREVEAGTGSDVYIPISMVKQRPGDPVTTSRPGSQKAGEVELSQIWITVTNPNDVEATVAVIESLMEKFHPNKDYSITVGQP